MQAAISPGSLLFLFITPSVSAEVSSTLYAGATYTSNLEVQASNDINANNQNFSTREGFETGFSAVKQALDYRGGYSLQAAGSLNKELSGDDNIVRLSLSASKLSALTPNWLMRNSIGFNWYDNEALETNSYRGIQLGSTFGYLNDGGGGSDITLSLDYEKHDQLASDTYRTNRSRLGVAHYFTHKEDAPYWSITGAYQRNNANDVFRDYDSLSLGISYRQWSLASFQAQMGFNWQQDQYDQRIVLSSLGTVIPAGMNNPVSSPESLSNITNTLQQTEMPNTFQDGNMGEPSHAQTGLQNRTHLNGASGFNSKIRKDNLYYFSLQLGKSLTPSVSLQLSASVGRFDSNLSEDSNDFYNIEARFLKIF